MKKLLGIVFLLGSITSQANVVVQGDQAKELMGAMYQAGIDLEDTNPADFGFQTVVVNNLVCHGHRDNGISGGIFSRVRCRYNSPDVDFPYDGGIPLQDSKELEAMLIDLGAPADAAMGQWYSWVRDLKCSHIEVNEVSTFECSFDNSF